MKVYSQLQVVFCVNLLKVFIRIL